MGWSEIFERFTNQWGVQLFIVIPIKLAQGVGFIGYFPLTFLFRLRNDVLYSQITSKPKYSLRKLQIIISGLTEVKNWEQPA
jgi:hypothetical protein